MDRQQISAKVREELAVEEDIVAVYLFGSLAQERAHTLSDVDVAVVFVRGTEGETLFRRTLEIGARLEKALQAPVDVVTLNQAPPLLCFQVIKTGQLVLERDRTERCLFHMRAMNAYYDAKPYLDYQRAETMRRIQEEGLGRGYRGNRDALAEARRLRETLAAASASAPE